MYSVLYVDDEPSLLEIGKIFLERSGNFRVTTMTSAEEALAAPTLAAFDAIVSDYQMPGMDGIAFLKEVREKYGGLPFVIFTGRGREGVVIEAINSGADFYVQKGGDPAVQFADLAHKVGLAIDRRQTQDELKAAYDKLSSSEEELRRNYEELAKSEDAFRQSEGRYRAVFENTGTATAMLEEDTTISLVNSRFVELSGFTAAEVEGKMSWHDFTLPEDIPFMDEQQRLMRTDPAKAKNRYEFRFRTKTGEIRDILLLEGTIPGTRQSVASLLDITDGKKAHDRISESEKKFALLFKSSPVTLTLVSAADGKFVDVNDAFVKNTGYTRDEVIGRKVADIGLIADPAGHDQMVAALKNRQIVSGREMLCRGKSGEIRICRFFSSLIMMSGQQYLLTTVDEITDRVRAEKALDESNRRFAQVAESAGEWIWEVDADGRYTYSSPVVEEILGYTPKEIVGTYFYDYFEAGKREELKNAALAVFKEKKTVQHFLNPCLHKDGHIVMLESSGSPVLADDGTLRGYRGADLDVTDRMRAENALDESRERYRLMLMNAKDGIMINEFTAKGPGKFIEVNDTACRILGMTRDELEGLSLVDLDTEETHQRAPGFVAELEKNRHAVFQIPYRPKTGTEKTLDISVSIFELEGRPTMFSIVRDITGQVAMEQALRTSEERFRALVETSPDMVWEIDPEGKFRYISPQIEKIMGYVPEEVVGRTTLNLVAEEGRAFAIRELEKHNRFGQVNGPLEVPARHRDGHDMVIEIRSSRVTDRNGNLTGFRGVARDITDQRKAEDALERANRQLTLLGSSTRHDALNKITGILGYLRIVSMKCTDPEAKDFLLKAEASVVSLRSLVEFTRIYQDLGSQEPLWKDLDAVMPRPQVPKTIAFSSEVSGIRVYADAMLEKVFANLLDNSVRHGEHVNEIRVSSRMDGTTLVVVWEDNGIGIVASDKEKIFGRGYGKNTGMGLFLIREILALTGISIRETGVPGSGARFEILVPEGKYRLAGRT
jgi:PAS domain S-box-containing protein